MGRLSGGQFCVMTEFQDSGCFCRSKFVGKAREYIGREVLSSIAVQKSSTLIGAVG
jgi:hypothetical protein